MKKVCLKDFEKMEKMQKYTVIKYSKFNCIHKNDKEYKLQVTTKF